MLFVAFRSPLRSAFFDNFDLFFECDSHHSESDEEESLSELERLVKLFKDFDFRSSCCFIFMIIFCLFVRFQKYAEYFKVTPHSHWESIKIAG